MESHVMIRGIFFRHEEKEPFVKSGKSIFGAVEYDMSTDRLKCHECGVLFASLASHIGHGAHDLTTTEYKVRHGLLLQTSLVSFEGKKNRSEASVSRKSGNIASLREASPDTFKNRNRSRSRNTEESRNDKGRCQAQLGFRITSFAQRIGRTPTTEELRLIGIGISVMLRTFKVKTIREVMAAVGLQPRPAGIRPDCEAA